MKILLIEPDHVLARQYQAYLVGAGHEVVITQNAQEAIAQTDKQTPDLVVLELLLAAHSGIEFLYEFRSYTEWQNVPAIILSRIPQTELQTSEDALKNLGVVAYLYKPGTSLKRLASRIAAFTPVQS